MLIQPGGVNINIISVVFSQHWIIWRNPVVEKLLHKNYRAPEARSVSLEQHQNVSDLALDVATSGN